MLIILKIKFSTEGLFNIDKNDFDVFLQLNNWFEFIMFSLFAITYNQNNNT